MRGVAWPIVGHLPAFRADSTGFLLDAARHQGDVARFRLGRQDVFLFAHPRDVRAVLVDHASSFRKGQLMQRARRLLGDGLLTSEGVLHGAQRRRIQPAFTRDRVHGFAAVVPAIADARVEHWVHGAKLRLGTEMDALTMSIVARTLLGVDIDGDLPSLGVSLRRLARWAPLLVLPGGSFFDRTRIPVVNRLRESIEHLEAVIDGAIAEGGTHAPLLAALLQHDDAGSAMPARLVRDEVMTTFLAGHDTTASALTWTWLLMARHPDVEARLADEVTRDPEGDLPFTNMIVKEVLRLYPPIGRIGRRAVADVQIGDVVVPSGALVFLSPYVTQRDPRWYANPDDFQPSRWSQPAPDRPPLAWFPFGAGSRSCIGEHFARAVMVQAIVTIARRWRLRAVRSQLPRHRSLLTLKPSGTTWMVAERRAG